MTELRRGFRSLAERRRALPLFAGCRLLEQPARPWEEAGDLGYALAHSVPVLAADADFAVMRKAGLQLLLFEP